MEIIKSDNLKYEYVQTAIDGEKTINLALDGVNINIEKGSFVSILGHNGSGKSTFAKCINALLTPSDGVIYVNGLDTKEEKNVWEIRKSCGMVFQNPDNQIVATIVEDDVAFGLENLGVPSNEIRQRVDDAMKWVGIDDFATTSPTLLSGGQKQRVAIAGILAMKPQCIVFDEPTAMLDPIGRKEVIRTAKMLNKEEGITIVLITHYMEETIDSDKVIVMKNGKVALEGTPKTVFCEVEKMEELGLTVPNMTKIAYNLNKLGLDIPKDILTIDEMVEEICRYK